jgi:hypothetical protein
MAVQADYHEKLNAITSFDNRIAKLTVQIEALYDKVSKASCCVDQIPFPIGRAH